MKTAMKQSAGVSQAKVKKLNSAKLRWGVVCDYMIKPK